jgi:hypothetical protein
MGEESTRVAATEDGSTAATEVTEVEPSAWDSIACSFWSIFDHKTKEVAAVPSKDAYDFPECDYDKFPTNLYKQIEAKNWTAVNHFLLTGYWSGSFFADSTPPQVQACTWVTKFEALATRKKRVQWTHLPIHAAVMGGAPQGTIQLLIKIAPPTLRCADDCRMLPLHLAFRRGAPDETVASIMEVFPEGVVVRDQNGRTPPECGAEGPNTHRGKIIETVLLYNQKVLEKKMAKAQEEHHKATEMALRNKDERIEHLKTALDLVRIRDDLTSQAFASIVADLRRFNAWYDHNKPALCAEEEELRELFVKDLYVQMMELRHAAENLRNQQKKRQKDSERTLKNLYGMWGESLGMKRLTNLNFNDLLKKQLRADDVSIVTADSNSDNKGDVKANAEAVKVTPEEVKSAKAAKEGPTLIKATAGVVKAKTEVAKAKPKEVTPANAVKAEPTVIESPQDKSVPHEVSTPTSTEEQDSGIDRAISEMTSIDMSESQSFMGEKMKSLKKGLKAITKTATKKSKVDTIGDPPRKTDSMGLPPKKPMNSAASIRGLAAKRLSANGVLTSPTF